jgi:type I restriction enzyme M protein
MEGQDDPTLINDDRFAPAGVLAPKSKADFAFVLHALSYLSSQRPRGDRLLSRHLLPGRCRAEDPPIPGGQQLCGNGDLAGPQPVLWHHHRREHPGAVQTQADTTTQFIDASGLFKKETNNNVLLDAHIEQIMAGVRQQGECGALCPIRAFEKVAANDYNLSVSSYIEAKDNREVVDIAQLNAELKTTVAKDRPTADGD